MTRRPVQRGSRIVRALRSRVACWIAVVVLAPLLALGALGGATLWVHEHDDQTIHVHGVAPDDAGPLAAKLRAGGHCHGSADGPDGPRSCPPPVERGCNDGQPPEGVLVSFPDHEQLPSRALDLSKYLSPGVALELAAILTPPPPDLARPIGSPGGDVPPGRVPLDLCRLSASDRLVRTSCALLI